jgi:membrane protein
MGWVGRLDGYQRRHRWIGLPLAVVYKFLDDQGTYLAAQLTYYGFLSLFPLLLLLVTVLSALLHNDSGLREQVLHSALSEFPVIGDQIGENIHSFHGNDTALVVGVLGSLYGALGIAQAAQNTLNKIWAVPRHARPDPFRSRFKSLLFLALLGIGLATTTLLSAAASAAGGFGTHLHLSAALRIVVALLAVVLNGTLLVITYHMLTQRRVPFRRLAGASLGAACAWQGLQWGGAYYVNHSLRGASATYGMFGIVLGLLAWIYLGALVFVIAAEVSVVRVRRLWPRSLLAPFTDNVRLSKGDRRAYRSYAATESFKSFERVRVDFDQPPPAAEPGDTAPEGHQDTR